MDTKPSVFITGAQRGLGLALCEVLLTKGFQVYASTRRQAPESLMALEEKYGNALSIFVLDVSSDLSVQQAAERFVSKSDCLDVLINNAGVRFDSSSARLEEVNFDAALQIFNVNSIGPLRVSRHFLPFLKKGRKRLIINISSEAGSISQCWREKEFDYCMSKAALNMQSVILHNYLQKDGLDILVVHPGWMRTDMGGADADIAPSTAAQGIAALMEAPRTAGQHFFVDYNGQPISW